MMLEVMTQSWWHHHWMMLEASAGCRHHHWMMLEVYGSARTPSLDDVRGPANYVNTIIG